VDGPGFFELSRPGRRRVRIREQVASVVPAVFAELEALIDVLPDPGCLCAEERAGVVQAAARLSVRLQAVVAATAASADGAGDARLFAAGSTGVLVAALTGVDPAGGSAMLRLGVTMAALPAVGAAFAAGRIGAGHVRVLARAAAGVDGYAQLEEALIEVAVLASPGELATIVDVLIDQSRPEHLNDQEAARHRKRGVSLTELPNGMFRLVGLLDTLAGQRLRDALVAAMDRAEAGDVRSPQQRRADALDDVVAAGVASRRPLGVNGLTVTVDMEGLPQAVGARLGQDTPIGSDLFDLLTCTAVVNVLLGVTRGTRFIPLQLARAARRASAGQWAALAVRDKGCVRCGREVRFTQAHHVVHWRHGGGTDLDNLCLLCGRCHTDLHQGRFSIVMVDGSPQVSVIGRRP